MLPTPAQNTDNITFQLLMSLRAVFFIFFLPVSSEYQAQHSV